MQHTFLVHFFAFSTRLPCENPWSDVLWGRWIFLSPTRLGFSPQEFNLNTGYGPEEFSSRKFAYIWPSDRVRIIAMKIERKQIPFYVAFSLPSPIAIQRELKQRRRRRQRERQKINMFRLAEQQLCTRIILCCTFHCRHCTTTTRNVL